MPNSQLSSAGDSPERASERSGDAAHGSVPDRALSRASGETAVDDVTRGPASASGSASAPAAARRVPPTAIRAIGLGLALTYAAAIAWMYAHQPRTFAEVAGGLQSSVGVYRIDRASFDEGLRFFHDDRFVEARSAFARADPAMQHAVTQFYIAYSFLRQGWGRVYSDDALLKEARTAVARAIDVAPGGRIQVDDPALTLKTADELKAEIDRGLTRDASDLNPLRVFGTRP